MGWASSDGLCIVNAYSVDQLAEGSSVLIRRRGTSPILTGLGGGAADRLLVERPPMVGIAVNGPLHESEHPVHDRPDQRDEEQE